MFETVLRRVLGLAFGGGADISPANPLPVDISPGASSYEEFSFLGTTGAIWANALNMDTREVKEKTIVLMNLDGMNSLNYRVFVSAYYAAPGQRFPEVVTTTLGPGAYAKIVLNNAYARVEVDVQDTVALTHVNYQVDYIARKF